MARPKFNSDGSSVIPSGYKGVKQLVRYMAKSPAGLMASADTIDSIDEELTGYLNDGYELFDTHYIGENPEGIGMIYVLVKQ